MKRNRLVNKKLLKLISGCKICGEQNPKILHVHRIIPGEKGGKYTEKNSVSLCSNCHMKVHSGLIEIHGSYDSTSGRVIHFTDENGVEKFN